MRGCADSLDLAVLGDIHETSVVIINDDLFPQGINPAPNCKTGE